MTSDAGVREGDIIAAKYRIERVIGAGAMGVVVAARHLKLDERVAIKFLQPETLGNKEAVARFEREARAAVKIKSEHVARVFDVGMLENGAPYMVMEHLEGGDLAAWLQQRGPLPIEQTVEFVLQALEAIAEAHGVGIVHRDLKPANLFCIRRADGLLSIKVLDFGISKIGGPGASAADMNMTATTDVMGSPLYMSPEQMQSARDVDARTDIWALGVILFQLMTGQAPFAAANMPELVMKIAMEAPTPLRSLLPQAPEGLERIILRCLQKDRTKRHPNVAELAVALAEFGSKRGRASAERIVGIIKAAGLSADDLAPPPSSGPTERARAEQTMDAFAHTSPKKARGKHAAVGAFLLIAAAIGISFFLVLRKSVTPAEPSTTDLPATAAPPAVATTLPTVNAALTNPPRGSAATTSTAEATVPSAEDNAATLPPAAAPHRANIINESSGRTTPAVRIPGNVDNTAPPPRNTRATSPRPAASVHPSSTARPSESPPAQTSNPYDDRK